MKYPAIKKIGFLFLVILSYVYLTQSGSIFSQKIVRNQFSQARQIENPPLLHLPKSTAILINSAKTQINITKFYDPAYIPIPYPNGDVPLAKGVCSDVVIRAFRTAGIDLQKEVHEDMAAHFDAYPNKWGLHKTDTNIDHRRVPNLQTYFTRKGKALRLTYHRDDYRPGDIVTWDINGYGLPHIGLVSNTWSAASQRYLIIHNIGQGAQLEDRLFDWRITGHYRYF